MAKMYEAESTIAKNLLSVQKMMPLCVHYPPVFSKYLCTYPKSSTWVLVPKFWLGRILEFWYFCGIVLWKGCCDDSDDDDLITDYWLIDQAVINDYLEFLQFYVNVDDHCHIL